MEATDDLITLVIHTPERAGILKSILESHGMTVKLEDFVVSRSTLRVAERVKIHAEDLPLALKIMESGDNYSSASIAMKMAGMSGNLLIPVDFSDSSMLSISVGFTLARRLGIHPVVMHAYVAPLFAASPFSGADPDALTGDTAVTIGEMKEIADIRRSAESCMKRFKKKISENMDSGILTEIEYSTVLLEGVAEEVILAYCRETPPMLVVMATRGVEKKEEELIGSVTAEVLDSCRVPVLTVPEEHHPVDIRKVRKLMMFCNVDQHDILAMDVLMRMFDYPECEVIMVPVVEKKRNKVADKIKDLADYFNSNFPDASFKVVYPEGKDFRQSVDGIIQNEKVELLIVPNKKTNIFSRIFHPTIAHRFLFERDMPMLALPV